MRSAKPGAWQPKLAVTAKWAGISVKQDFLITGGIGQGLAEAGVQDVEGLAQFMTHPIEGLKGMAEVVSNPDVRKALGETAYKSLLDSIGRMETALENGGDDRDLGNLIYTVGGVVSGMGGAAKAGLTLAKIGVEVSSKVLGKMELKEGAELG